jgi:hypothetical protein
VPEIPAVPKYQWPVSELIVLYGFATTLFSKRPTCSMRIPEISSIHRYCDHWRSASGGPNRVYFKDISYNKNYTTKIARIKTLHYGTIEVETDLACAFPISPASILRDHCRSEPKGWLSHVERGFLLFEQESAMLHHQSLVQ